VLRNKQWGVYVARRDGSAERRMSSADLNATWTSWSPDGRALAFAAGSQGRTDIVVVSVRDGNHERKVTSDGAMNSAPSWSPDGKRLVFTSRRAGKSHLYIVNADGSDLHQLTSGDANESNPQWSLDGASIVFYSDRRGKLDVVCRVDAEGKDEQLLTAADIHAIYPSWSQRGEVLFTKANEGKTKEIMLLDRDGRVRRLERNGFFARLSPDGKLIAIIEGAYPQSRIIIDTYRRSK